MPIQEDPLAPAPVLTEDQKQLLDRYYELWLDGLGAEDIRQELQLTPLEYTRLEPHVLAHCRIRLAREVRDDLVQGFARDRAKLTPERKAELFKYVAAAGNLLQALKVMGIPLATFTEVWTKQDPMISEEVEMLVDKWNLDSAAALHRRAIGEERPFRTKTVTKGKALDKEGNLVNVGNETVTEGTKYLPPDFNSLRFELVNRMPEKYTLDGAGASGGARGRLLTALDAIIAGEQDSARDAAYDADNEARHGG